MKKSLLKKIITISLCIAMVSSVSMTSAFAESQSVANTVDESGLGVLPATPEEIEYWAGIEKVPTEEQKARLAQLPEDEFGWGVMPATPEEIEYWAGIEKVLTEEQKARLAQLPEDEFGWGVMPATPEEIEYWAGIEKVLTEEQKARLSQAPEAFAAVTWYYLNPIYYFAQEKSNSCVSACVRMALKYLTGVIYSEATIRDWFIANGGSTSLSNAAIYLNSQ